MTITKRLAFNESRRRGRSRILRRPDDEGGLPEDIGDAASTPDKLLEQEELHRAIERAMASLPEKERMAVILRRYEGMPYEEIAEVLETSVSAVKSLLFRARTTLRDHLASHLE
jgi:RNA polymerase sigma-70 factor (ECF subfamily)